MRLVDHVYDDQLLEQVTVKVVLPEHEYQNRKNKFNEYIIIIFKITYLFCIFNLAFITDNKKAMYSMVGLCYT
jgi:hypothetical protein